jgi:2-polyprenyl-3-methyl-5-hydroxy-6-metoxy-1,4-benzoquinol methylase
MRVGSLASGNASLPVGIELTQQSRKDVRGQGQGEDDMSPSWSAKVLHRVLCLGPHTCPWWFAYTFDNPLRGLVHDPSAILGDLVRPGDRVIDLGCGLGFFTLALARLVGAGGTVVAVDLQEEMLRRTRRRAERCGLAERVAFRQCAPDRIGVEGVADFVLALWMVHEVSQPDSFLAEIWSLLRPSGHLLVAEPKGHVPESFFARTVERARKAGFLTGPGPAVRFSRVVLCSKPA